MTERLLIPTLKGYRDMLRTAVTEENESKAVLFHPKVDDYVLKNGCLYCRGSALSYEQIISLVSNPEVNKSLKEPILPYALFSFMYSKGDVRNNARLETTESELCSFLGVSTGGNGFKLIEKLRHLQYVYGEIPTRGVFPFLQIEEQQAGRYVLTSEYLHHVLNMMLAESFEKYGHRARYYTNKVHSDIVAVRNKTAAVIVIELSHLIVTAGRQGKPHMTLQELVLRIPQLLAIWTSTQHRTGFRNRQLKRAFEPVVDLMREKTALYDELLDLDIQIPRLDVTNPKAVIRILHNGYRGARCGGTEQIIQ
ncbi:hypothetical protein [Cohnella yongneupensis]|uniref:Uncharacterized protein n=1 Tax=Cohnella yongneupensis TaxID=425006 RepID=A0ABW0R007_9BACL